MRYGETIIKAVPYLILNRRVTRRNRIECTRLNVRHVKSFVIKDVHLALVWITLDSVIKRVRISLWT